MPVEFSVMGVKPFLEAREKLINLGDFFPIQFAWDLIPRPPR